jgi:hypothetical protein
LTKRPLRAKHTATPGLHQGKTKNQKIKKAMAPFYDDPAVHWDDPNLRWDEPTPPPRMAETKTTYPVNEVLGFASSAKDMLTTYKTQMTAAGVDPTALITKLGTDHTDLSAKNNVQEGFKTQLRDQTKLVEAANSLTYADCSRACDMIITAFGRNSEQAQEATNLRKSIRPVTRKATPPTP